ncbi:hypothetical protein Rhopal_000695-T1 [Rhodotorula paludigena]|uniref:Uncharacterized protein n=1 Tax=Rhodotorula paludigena TaxID=86838 RepID=A0AAV5G5R8_9BASI|nr:hypothetical protein Rhopal_000695-T1 [Rhodotorula paludigena]
MLTRFESRGLLKRTPTQDAGRDIQDWISRQSPDLVFGLTITAGIVSLLVVLACIWETLRRCRTSAAGAQERWQHLEDGSSYRVAGRQNGGANYRGPMATLLHGGGPNGERPGQGYAANGHQPPHGSGGILQSFFGGAGHRDGSRQGYVPTRSGEDGDMRMQALSLNGFSAYDPPPPVLPMQQQQPVVERHALVDLGPIKPENERRASMNTVWSGDTRVGEETVKKVDEATTLDKPVKDLYLPPTESPVALPHAPAKSDEPLKSSSPSISRSINTHAGSFPLPGTPRTSQLPPPKADQSIPSTGEAAFSTPKPTASPLPVVTSSPARPKTHQRAQSSGGTFTPMPLSLSASASTRSAPEPPKVELKRTWSIGTWIPQLKEGGPGREEGKKDGGAEEKAGLVGAEGK